MVKHPQGHIFYRQMAHDYPVIQRGEGIHLYDAKGQRYIDASGGPLVVNVGHGVSSIADALAKQAAQVAYVHGSLFTTAPLETYSGRLAARVPLLEPRFYYLSSGSEAVETALKFARQVQLARGESQRDRVISRWGSYHGMTLGTLAVSGKPSMRQPYAPMFLDMPHIEPPYCYRCPFAATYPECDLACARQLEMEILRQGTKSVAAFIAEPVGGATLGAIVPPDGYWSLIREICDRYQVLLIADEVLTGFGRTGVWFAMERFGAQPDVMTLAKGATAGYYPLSITAVLGAHVEMIRQAHGDFNHGGTFSHHAVGAAAALATMDYLEGNDLISRAAQVGAYLGQRLVESLSDLTSVGDVRGIGMMWAIEFVANRETKAPYPRDAHFADRVCAHCMEMGVLLYPGHGSADGMRGDHLMVAPPFIATEGQVDVIVGTLREAIRKTEASK
ncbi:MAG TPA: aspartate aminotransferase family protein [Anaerolineae bacterium]|nr:aspartate aminotransferase family protein [Anaerolineae bacterium]